MIGAGIDCGAKNTKTIILKDGQIIGKGKVLTGFDQEKALKESWETALKDAGLASEEVEKICGTGAGKDSIEVIGGSLVNDIKAVAKAAHYFFPNAGTVVDVGAEEGRAVRTDKDGKVVDFAVNEKCAAGAGTFIETMARALEVSLEEMGPMSLTSDKEVPMNAQCVIFAESEVVGLIHANTPKPDISKAIHDAMAGRIVSMIRRLGAKEDVVMIGGVAYNLGFVGALKRELKLENVYIPEYPEYGAAVGAALLSAEEE